MPEPATAAAGAAEITAILGPADAVLLADILRTGASAAEVQEAFSRLEARRSGQSPGAARRRGRSR